MTKLTMKTLWSKVEPILWFLGTVYLCLVAYGVFLYPAKFWAAPFWGHLLVYVIIVFWWTAFKSRLAKFLRESLREMIAEELAKLPTDAKPLLEKALAADPNYADALYQLGTVYASLGDNAKAKETLEKALLVAPKHQDAATARAMLDWVKTQIK